MIRVQTNRLNDDYIDFNRDDVVLLAVTSKVPKNIQDIISDMHKKINAYEKEEELGKHFFLSIRKDSDLGRYLLTAKNIGVVNEDKEITYRKVVNAFNYAILEENKIYEKIYPLLKNKVVGTYENLFLDYEEDTLNYILENGYFNIYNPEGNTKIIPQSFSDTLVYDFDKTSRNIYTFTLKSK